MGETGAVCGGAAEAVGGVRRLGVHAVLYYTDGEPFLPPQNKKN